MSSKRNSILCPNCRKLISMDEPACPYCGLIRPGLHNTAGIIRKIFLGSDPVRTIIYINIAFYVLSLLLNPEGIYAGGGLFNFLSPYSVFFVLKFLRACMNFFELLFCFVQGFFGSSFL